MKKPVIKLVIPKPKARRTYAPKDSLFKGKKVDTSKKAKLNRKPKYPPKEDDE